MIVIITVDVEGSHSQTPVESMIYGKIGHEEYGINRIMDVCDRFEIKASFFVDVYEYALHGSLVMEQVTKDIVERKHDVQLHTHPAWPIDSHDEPEIQQWKKENCLYDSERPWMHQYDLQEQLEIIRNGKVKLEQWSGTKIIAHRAGGYGANETTLAAAKLAGLDMDFSAFLGHKNCHLKAKANIVQTIKGIVEVPVTGFFRPNYVRLPWLPFRRKFVKTDIDWAFLNELIFFYNAGQEHGLNVMVLFMHSYSFVKFSPRFNSFNFDDRKVRRLEKFIQWALESNASFITVNQFWETYRLSPKQFQGKEYIPTFIG